jgi:hypothetical protein
MPIIINVMIRAAFVKNDNQPNLHKIDQLNILTSLEVSNLQQSNFFLQILSGRFQVFRINFITDKINS